MTRPWDRRGSCPSAHLLQSIGLVMGTALLGLMGCGKPARPGLEPKPVPEVSLIRPARGAVRWTVQQPGSIEAFEETAIVPKIPGYVEKWNFDLGDRVKTGDVLAVLWVPDLVKELDQRKAEVEQARQVFAVAEAHVASVATLVAEAQAGLHRARADLTFRQMQHNRVNQLLQRAVVNKEVEEEAWNEQRAAEAHVREAEAKLAHAEAELKESEATRDKCRIDIAAAQAACEKVQALVNYATLTAPFDGVVTRRNINTGDFVQPPTSAPKDPVYVVARRDVMRIFVEVPEADAVWVQEGAAARVRIPVLKDREFAGTVRRMSYALKPRSRTLLAEIDLPNPEDLLRPGMYAHVTLEVERTNLLTLPVAAVATQGDVNEGYQDYCFVWENGKARRLLVQVGSRDDERVQVLKKRIQGAWVDFTGKEEVIQGDLSFLSDGQEVKIAAGRQCPAPTGPPSRSTGS
jgi:HlyD family secretion protein